MMPVEAVVVSDALRLINEFSDEARLEAGEQHDPYRSLPDGEGLNLPDAIGAANRLHHAITSDDAIIRLNQLADDCALAVRLDQDGNLQWLHNGAVPALARFLAPLLDFVDKAGIDRLGACAAEQCVDLFADRSHAGTRHYCCQRCATRSRVTAWRERNR